MVKQFLGTHGECLLIPHHFSATDRSYWEAQRLIPGFHMSSEHYRITALAPKASFVDALRTHWREYLMEAAELAAFMVSVCTVGTLLYGQNSPLDSLGGSQITRSILMGVGISSATYAIIRSPFGRRSGAHFNPALTFTYFRLGRMHRWDALAYIAAQFVGGAVGVFVSHVLLGPSLASVPVLYVVTTPGTLRIRFCLSHGVRIVVCFDGSSANREQSSTVREV